MIKRVLPALVSTLLCLSLLNGCNLWQLMGEKQTTNETADWDDYAALALEPIGVRIGFAANGGSVPEGSAIAISAQVTGARAPLELALWVNGAPFAVKKISAQEFRPSFELPWVMGSDAVQIILRVTDATGAQGTSNLLSLTPTRAITGYTEVIASAGDTREKLAARFGVDAASVVVPGTADISASAEIPPNTLVEVYPGGGEPQAPASIIIPAGFTAASGQPVDGQTPALEIKLDDGVPLITFSSQSAEASSLTLYRAIPEDGVFKPLHVQEVKNAGEEFTFTDGQVAGDYAYYFAAAVNPSGQISGDITRVELPARVPVGAAEFPPVFMAGDGYLGVKSGIDNLYFYASLDQSQYIRVPETGFIQVEGGRLNLNEYIDPLLEEGRQPTRLQMEVWSWDGRAPQYLGRIDTLLARTSLKVCAVNSARCRGVGSGDVFSPELNEAVANTNIPGETKLLFPWETSLKFNPDALVQVSRQPFTGEDNLKPQGLVYSRGVTGECGTNGCGGVFAIDFDQLFKDGKAGLALGETNTTTYKPLGSIEFRGNLLRDYLNQDIISTIENTPPAFGSDVFSAPSIYPIDFYVRVIPFTGLQPGGSPSNTVVIHYGPKEATQVTLFPTVTPPPQPPQVYDAKIVEFTEPVPPSLGWGCVYITSVSTGAFNAGYYRQLMNEHKAYCPQDYRGEGGKSWYESFWEFATGAVNWVSQFYEDIKAEIVSNVAAALDSAGICNNCEAVISAALNAGLVALGIPPELPDMSKLTDMGVDYLVEQAATAMGVPCDATCMETVREGVEDFADQMKSKTVSVYQDEEEAHKHGREPLFVPPGVSVEPAKEANWQMASLRVLVSRKAGTENISAAELQAIESVLYITARGYNDRTGQSYTVFNCWEGGCNLINPSPDCDAVAVPGCPEPRQVTAPLEGNLFKPVIIELGGDQLPHLAPGETKELNLVMLPSVYWIPGHEEDTTYEWYDDWGYLYEGGIATLALDLAAQACVKNISGYPPSCSYTLERTDYREIQLPDTSTYGFDQMWTSK